MTTGWDVVRRRSWLLGLIIMILVATPFTTYCCTWQVSGQYGQYFNSPVSWAACQQSGFRTGNETGLVSAPVPARRPHAGRRR
jgi:hypothetical protein